MAHLLEPGCARSAARKRAQMGAMGGRPPSQTAPRLADLPQSGPAAFVEGSQHRDQRPIPAEPTTAQPLCEARKRWLVHQVLHHRKAEVLEIVRRVKRAKRSHDRLLRPIRDNCAHRRGESGHRGQHPAYLPGCTSLPLLLGPSWRASGFKDQACQSVPLTDHVHFAVASQNTSGQLRKVPRQVLHDMLDIERKPRGRVAVVAGNKRRAPFGDWEAMAVVASSHIDDPRWQGLVFQDDVHHACPTRCPCPLFRVSWAQPKGDSCRCHCPLPEGPGINLQPMFPPAHGFHKGETGDVELRQPHSGGPPGSGDCNSKSQRGGVFRLLLGGEHMLTILKVRLPLVGCVGVVAMESRPLCNLINVVAQALSLTPRAE